jgi:signal transduction histidine kinase
MDVKAVSKFGATFVTETTSPPTPRPRRLRRGRFDLVEVADVLVALICLAITNSTLTNQNASHDGHHGAGLLVLVAFVDCAPLVLRTRFPLSAWATSGAALIWTSLVISPGSLGGPAVPAAGALVYGLCLYAVAVRCRPRIVVAAAAATLAGALFIDASTTPAAVFLTAVPILLGVVVRVRRSGARQLEEQERRHSGERALLEERQRIARELHDVVAHHMSVIAIQAEAAPYKTADPPPELVESFGDIRASALAGLTELRRVLGVLRTGGPDTTPQPGLADLETLLDLARGGGLSATVTYSGNPVPLPDGVDLSAYRIVQEALSNAMRHAPGSHVHVHLAYRPDGLALEVRNAAAPARVGPARVSPAHVSPAHVGPARVSPDGAVPALVASGVRAAGGGHGIIGMRERATMLGGTLDVGPADDGGFRVTAVLPVGPPKEAT